MEEKKDIVLITGCTGTIGFRCAEKLSFEYKIIGVDVFLVGHLPGIDLVGIDLASEKNIEEHLDLILERFGNKIASVVHLAAYYNFSKGGWKKYQQITIDGTKNFIEGLLKRFEVGQFIFSSSMLVHAPCKKGEKINELSPIEPKWNYPKSKVITEDIVRGLKGKIPYVILRIAGVYDDECHSIPLAHQTQRIYENKLEAHLFPGDLIHGAAFVHLEDAVEAIYLSIQKRKELPEELVLLIGEPNTLSYGKLQEAISKEIFNKKWKTYQIPKLLAMVGAWIKQHIPFVKKGFIQPWMIPMADDNYELDISQAEKYLGWNPKKNLKDTIPKWIDLLKREPLAWYDINKLNFSGKVREHD